jgi:hypothetical protein
VTRTPPLPRVISGGVVLVDVGELESDPDDPEPAEASPFDAPDATRPSATSMDSTVAGRVGTKTTSPSGTVAYLGGMVVVVVVAGPGVVEVVVVEATDGDDELLPVFDELLAVLGVETPTGSPVDEGCPASALASLDAVGADPALDAPFGCWVMGS